MEGKKKGKKSFYFTIVSLINQGLAPSQICLKLNLSKQTVNYYISRLKNDDLIKKIGYGVWEINQPQYRDYIRRSKNSTLGRKEIFTSFFTSQDFRSNIHALEILIPIGSGSLDLVKDFEGYLQEGLKGWTPEYKRVLSPLGFTLRNNNNKSVSVFLWSREIPRNFDITGLVTGLVAYVYDLLKKKDVILNIFEAKLKTLHLSVSNKDLDRVFNKGERFEVLLGRACDKVLPKDEEREAKAWVDSSPYLGVETNDIRYKNNLVLMPERVESLTNDLKPVLADLTVQIKTHLIVMNEIKDGIRSFNKTVKNLNSKLSQTTLRGYL